MRRRTLLLGAAALVGTGVFPASGAQTGSGKAFDVDVAVGEDRPDPVMATLREVGATKVEAVKSSGLGGTETFVAGVLLATGLANLVMRLLKMWSCGVVVDARGARITVKRQCDLARGTVQVINPDATRSNLKQPTAPELQSLIEKFPPK